MNRPFIPGIWLLSSFYSIICLILYHQSFNSGSLRVCSDSWWDDCLFIIPPFVKFIPCYCVRKKQDFLKLFSVLCLPPLFFFLLLFLFLLMLPHLHFCFLHFYCWILPGSFCWVVYFIFKFLWLALWTGILVNTFFQIDNYCETFAKVIYLIFVTKLTTLLKAIFLVLVLLFYPGFFYLENDTKLKQR